jgi:DNA polymerase-1
MTDVVVYDPAAVVEKWGVDPARVPDYLGLMGDSSDNIPGVPGVGPKKATKLLQQYGTLEGVLAHADEIAGKLGENVRANAEQARASREVATIIRDVPIEDCDLMAVTFPAFDAREVTEAFREFAFSSQLNKVLALIGEKSVASASGGESAVQGDSRPNTRIANTDASRTSSASSATVASSAALQATSSAAPPAASAEPSALPNTPLALFAPLTGNEAYAALDAALEGDDELAVLIEARTGDSLFDTARLCYIATENSIMVFNEEDIVSVCARVARESRFIALNSKALLQELLPPNSAQPAALDVGALDAARVFDLSLAAYLLDSSRDYTEREPLFERFFPGELPEPSEDIPRGAICAAAFLRLAAILRQRLADDRSLECFSTIEMPLVFVLVQMERWGVNVDPSILEELGRGITADIAQLRLRAIAEAGEEFNLDSPRQLGTILFEKLKLPLVKKTRTGYSTDAGVLQEVKGLHPLPAIMLEYRELAKLKSTYLDALPQLIASDRHIHTSYNQAVAATGRLSSSDPNLQNIPVRTELGRRIRTAFIPDASVFAEGEAVFLSADYSQIELRLLAHLSGDEGLIEAFAEGEDFHASTAARVFGVPVGEVDPQLRSRAKAVNFGIVYGQQAYGLAQSLGVGFQEAQEMIARYFRAYPQVRRYLDETVEQAREQGWVQTLYGRKRHIGEIHSSNANTRAFGERTAMNHPMQGSAADIIKLAMIEVTRRLKAEGLVSQMVLQVHDELDFNCAASEVERLSALVKEVMEGVAKLKAPLVADVSLGPNWAEAH